jgi:glycerol-3-phosphate dehydrogenase
MGRCQGGFCSPLIIEILARELGIPEEEVRKRGEKAFMLASDND